MFQAFHKNFIETVLGNGAVRVQAGCMDGLPVYGSGNAANRDVRLDRRI